MFIFILDIIFMFFLKKIFIKWIKYKIRDKNKYIKYQYFNIQITHK
jgi:hypothetical protein